MAMFELKGKPMRVEDFAHELEYRGDRAVDVEPALEDIATLILARERRLFETRGASGGRYWSPLKGSTVQRKKRSSHVVDIMAPLRETDALMKSLSERNARYSILRVKRTSLVVGTSHPAAGFHAEGTRDMPRRPPLVIAKKHSHEYIGMINDYIFGRGDYA
jgi:hypothetical protein